MSIAFTHIACLPTGHEENFDRLTDRTIPGAVSANEDNETKTAKTLKEEALDKAATISIKAARTGTINLFKGTIELKATVTGTNIQTIELSMIDGKKNQIAVTTKPCKSGETVEIKATYDKIKTQWFELLLINGKNQVIARHLRPAK